MVGTVTAMVSNQTATIEDAKTWVKAMGAKGKWTDVATRNRLTALEAVSSMLGPDDDHSARAVLEKVDVLTRDWATKNTKDGKTQANYRGSVRSTLRIYLAYLEDPAKAQAQFDAVAAKPRKPKAKAEDASEELPLAPPAAATAATGAAVQKVAPQGDLLSYPLGDGRVVRVSFPENFTIRDLAKFSCFAATFCADFDPTRPNQGTIVAMARIDEQKQ
jgi:hypothetical protein